VLLQEHTENHADDPTWWWTLVGYLKAHHAAGRLPADAEADYYRQTTPAEEAVTQ
jgi:hypothetical protein